MSKLEQHISTILSNASISYCREFKITDLRAGLYRFDFYLPKQNVFIEVNGAQHYIYTSYFYKIKSEFLKAQERDRRKIAYCLAHDIKLYIIPYWDIESIRTSKDLFQQKYLATSKFHNDEAYRNHFSKI